MAQVKNSSEEFKEKMSSVLDAIDASHSPSLATLRGANGTRGSPPGMRSRSRSPVSTTTLREHRGKSRNMYHRNRGRGSRGLKPDHATNPSKWTKYNLDNDGTKELKKSGMSTDQVNRFAALQFLKEMKDDKEPGGEGEGGRGGDGGGNISAEGGKVVFKKPAKKLTKSKERETDKRDSSLLEEGGGGGGASVHLMPEYQVGREENRGRKKLSVLGRPSQRQEEGREMSDKERTDPTSKKKDNSSKRSSITCNNVSLSHLEDEDD